MKKRLLTTMVTLMAAAALSYGQYDRDVFYFRGRQAINDGKYSQAIENFNVLTRLDTTDYWAFFFRGIAKYNLGDIRGAQQDFDNSVRLDPVFTYGYHYKAVTQSRSGEYDAALENLQRAIDLRPGLEGLYFSRGVTYFLAQRFDDAVKDFDYYIRKSPKDPSAYLNRGASYLYLGDTTRALNDYNKAIKLDRFEPEGFIRRGRLYADRADYSLALKDMDRAIELDSTSTFAYFNRALMYYESKDYNRAMADLDRVLREDPGNALTLYNRSLIRAQVGDYEAALADMDRVININPGNVLAYFNRAGYFLETGRWRSALEDYDKTIELYPDFAKAYMNRAYVKNLLGMQKESKADYDTANEKVASYKAASGRNADAFSDTTSKYSGLLSLDADFAKKDFDNELLQHRDIDIRLRPLYKFVLSSPDPEAATALSRNYENVLVDRFKSGCKVPVEVSNSEDNDLVMYGSFDNMIYGDSSSGAGTGTMSEADICFVKGLYDLSHKQYSMALSWFDKAVKAADEGKSKDRYTAFYKAFYRMNRGVLRSEMIDFMASIQSNVQTLTMDDKGAIRARVGDDVSMTYDYSEAVEDMEKAIELAPDVAYLHYNLGNLNCLSSNMVGAVENYGRAISLYPYMGDAYYNRGLVLIYLRDREKGCIDLSRAGELGVGDAYSVISKYCEDDRSKR